MGLHITPNHFYGPVPDTRRLKDELWSKQSELIGIDLNEEGQLALLSLFVSKFKSEYDRLPATKPSAPYRFHMENSAFSSVDAELLYCIIRYFKPQKIFEIGSGYSTYLSAQAILANVQDDDQYRCDFVVVDPYPNPIVAGGLPGLSKLIRAEVQDVPASDFKTLNKNDILFIDSSHVLKTGSDVRYEYLEILPRLNDGVLIHFHDILLPAEYHKKWILKEYRFWNEQYLLQAFLCFNEGFEVLWAGSYMHMNHPDKLEAAFNSYNRERKWPSSFWIRRTR